MVSAGKVNYILNGAYFSTKTIQLAYWTTEGYWFVINVKEHSCCWLLVSDGYVTAVDTGKKGITKKWASTWTDPEISVTAEDATRLETV